MNLVHRPVTENTGMLGTSLGLIECLSLNQIHFPTNNKANKYMIALVMTGVQLVVRVLHTSAQTRQTLPS